MGGTQVLGKRVFVAGGAGVIGKELVGKLISQGAEVLVGDLKPRPNSFSQSIAYRQGDLNALTSAEFCQFAPDVLINLAATFERSTESFAFWNDNFHHNVSLSHHLMTLAQACRSLRRVVFASSYLVYDQSLYQFRDPPTNARRLQETDPVRPRNLTGMAKLSHEQELDFLVSFSETQFSTVAARIFRGYGRGSRDVISRWIRSLLAGRAISVYRPEGIFDFIHAADSAEGLLRLASCPQATGVVNLGTGRSRRISEVLDILTYEFPSAVMQYVCSDIAFEASEACTQRLESLVAWTPTRQLEDTIPEIIRFEREVLQASS